MKNTLRLIALVCILFISQGAKSQSFYEGTWRADGVLYNALVIFYDDNDILVRTRYKLADVYKVAEFKATAEIIKDPSGDDVYLIDGEDATIVYGPEGGYSADNFMFYSHGSGEWQDYYAIDDNGWASDNASDMLNEMTWKQLDPETDFTEQFAFNYFERTDQMYNIMLSYNPSNVTDVAGVNGSNDDGEWRVVMSQGTGFGEQSWVTRYEFPKEKIKEYWADDKSITDVSYGNGLWLVTMSKQSGYDLQSWSNGAKWPNEWIEKKWDDDKMITEVAYGDGTWAVVMSTNTGYTKQIYSVSKKWPKEWLDEQWKNGPYSFTSIAYGAGHWAIVLSDDPTNNSVQRIRAGAEFPADEIRTGWADGYDVSTMAYGDEWVVILTKGLELRQSYDSGDDFPKPFVAEKWDEGYSISEAIYKYEETSTNHYLNFTGTASTTGGSNNTISHTTNPQSTTVTAANPSITAIPRMHLITVANTQVPDIGASCAVDRDIIHDEFDDITEGLGIDLLKHTIDGTNLSKSNVTSAINRIDVKPNDIVVFVYTGHGYRWSNQTSRFPQIALFYSRYDSPENSNSYNLETVYDMIVKKGARLNLVLGDCCNNDLGVTSRDGGGGLASRTYTRGDKDRLRKLFFESRGNIIAAAAQPNETACGSRVSGGYFLNAFFSAIDKEVSYTATGNADWADIFKRTMSSATYKTQNLNGCTIQHGVYKGL
ncbi:MAG: caspase family protein [Crocinitomicaceae bacterium]|nr:caspase family protein [Crocinitomicaceae bacterium]